MFRFIERNLLRGRSESLSSFGPDPKITQSGSFNLYEVGSSDPNQLKPREFKYHKGSVPIEIAD